MFANAIPIPNEMILSAGPRGWLRIPTLKRWRWEGQMFEVNLGYMVSVGLPEILSQTTKGQLCFFLLEFLIQWIALIFQC